MVFLRQPLILAPDLAHSASEARYYALGQTPMGRLLFVVFTLRGTLIRIISARDQSRREREVYRHAQEADPEGPAREVRAGGARLLAPAGFRRSRRLGGCASHDVGQPQAVDGDDFAALAGGDARGAQATGQSAGRAVSEPAEDVPGRAPRAGAATPAAGGLRPHHSLQPTGGRRTRSIEQLDSRPAAEATACGMRQDAGDAEARAATAEISRAISREEAAPHPPRRPIAPTMTRLPPPAPAAARSAPRRSCRAPGPAMRRRRPPSGPPSPPAPAPAPR